jgi:ABC-2 type transport system ATP-binding protein
MAQAIVQTQNLSRWYGQVIGITDVNLEIGPGVTALLGPNGAGKSTLMKVLTGQLKPSNGSARIFGQPIWNNPHVLSRMGLCPEQDAFYEEMSPFVFVSYLTRLHGYTAHEADKIALRTLEIVDLVGRKDDKIKTFSKGMRQRTKIAQAIAHDPDVLFLDEPLLGTDPIGRRRIIELAMELGERGKTVIVSSHVLHEVEAMTSNILLINKGRLIADGDIYQIRTMIDQHPHSIFIEADRPREFASLLTRFDDILGVSFEDEGIKVSTKDPNACYDRIPRLALEHKIQIRRLTSPDNDLAAVFRYLTQVGYQQRAGA